MEGILRCSRYAFGPNRLHYCGPDANTELKERIDKEGQDLGLTEILRQFKTLYPYLTVVAKANHISDPFDSRVVEAYWLGNNLLETIGKEKLYRFLLEDLDLKKRGGTKEFKWLESKIAQGALPHHSFHVLNIWRQNNTENESQLIESLSECIVNYGSILEVNGPEITVMTSPLLYAQKQFILGSPTRKNLTRHLEAEYDIEQLKVGQIVTYHWSVPCEVITKQQANRLKKYTLQNITFINQTI